MDTSNSSGSNCPVSGDSNFSTVQPTASQRKECRFNTLPLICAQDQGNSQSLTRPVSKGGHSNHQSIDLPAKPPLVKRPRDFQ